MAYIQRNKIPPNNKLFFNTTDFSGGLNNRDSYIEMESNQSSDMLNIDFWSEVGVVEKRAGTLPYDAFDIGGAVTFMDTFKPYTGAFSLIRASNTEVYNGEIKIADVAGQVDGLNFMGKYYIVDGSKIQIYDGTDTKELLKAPESHLSAEHLLGVTTIAIDVWDSRIVADMVIQIESESGTETVEILATNEAGLDFTIKVATTLDHASGSLVRFYVVRDISYTVGIENSDATSIWYEPCQNELDDEYQGENVLPVEPQYVVGNDSRIYFAGMSDNKHAIYVSDTENGLYTPVYTALGLQPNGDAISSLQVFHDTIIVGRQEDIHAIYGDTNRLDVGNLYNIGKVNTHTGISNNRSARLMHNYLVFLGGDGEYYVMHTPKTNIEVLATTQINKKVDLKKYPISSNDSDIQANIGYYRNGLYFSIIGDKTMVYSYLLQAWGIFGGIDATIFHEFDGELLIGDSTGNTHKWGYGFSDSGNAIDAYWHSKRFDFGYPSRLKKIRDLYIIGHVYDNYDSDIQVGFEVDYIDIDAEFSLKNTISRWGEAIFGDIFITRNILKSLPIIVNQRGRLMSFVIRNNIIDQGLKIYEVNGQYELKGFR